MEVAMNTSPSYRIAVTLFGALVAVAALPANAADCTAPKGTGEARACAEAKQGADALRRFLQRTQPIYLLTYADFAAAVPQTAAGDPSIVVATKD